MTYLQFRHNVHSANGEDGIIKKLFSDLNITSGIVCEFGAANGLDDSNTAALWKENYQAILIESDSTRFNELQKNISEHDIKKINIKTLYFSDFLMNNQKNYHLWGKYFLLTSIHVASKKLQ